MPTYDYKCKDCGHKFELFQSMSEEPIEKCPECSGTVERLIGTGGGLIFRGSGFYTTDYRSDSYNKGAKADKASPPANNSTPKKKKKDESSKVSKAEK